MSSRESPHAGGVRTGAESEVIASAYVNMWNDRDYAAIPRLVSENFVMYDPAVPAEGVSGPKGEAHGREGLREFMELLTVAFPDFQISVLDILTDGNLAMYEVRLTMTHDGPLGGLPPTGRRVELRGVSILRLEAVTIDEHVFHTDMNEANEQLGLAFPQVVGQLPKLLIGKVRMSL